MNYYYHYNDVDSLIFKPIKNNYNLGFEMYSKGESTTEMKLATYSDCTWKFDDKLQRSKFLTLMQQDKKSFQRAFKNYWWSLNEKPTQWECGYRKLKVKKFRMKRDLQNWFYKTFSTYNK
jgi:hypothetical protein